MLFGSIGFGYFVYGKKKSGICPANLWGLPQRDPVRHSEYMGNGVGGSRPDGFAEIRAAVESLRGPSLSSP